MTTDWHSTNHEAAAELTARYGHHRPTYAKVGAGWTSACCCGSDCARAFDARLYPTWHEALDAARANLTRAEAAPTEQGNIA